MDVAAVVVAVVNGYGSPMACDACGIYDDIYGAF
jgi:hypothetical protein